MPEDTFKAMMDGMSDGRSGFYNPPYQGTSLEQAVYDFEYQNQQNNDRATSEGDGCLIMLSIGFIYLGIQAIGAFFNWIHTVWVTHIIVWLQRPIIEPVYSLMSGYYKGMLAVAMTFIQYAPSFAHRFELTPWPHINSALFTLTIIGYFLVPFLIVGFMMVKSSKAIPLGYFLTIVLLGPLLIYVAWVLFVFGWELGASAISGLFATH